MKILAIESSCDETACAVIEDGRKICSSVVATQIQEHQLYGGVVPEIASRRHTEAITEVVRSALEQAACALDDVEAIAVTYAPGLIGSLLVGVNFAKGLALAKNKPLVPVHHIRGHIAANYLTHPGLEPPFLCLVVSGGHSHIIQVLSYTQFAVIGKTMDDAAGEAFDKAARALGFPYPGGVYLDKAAQKGNKNAFALPHPKVEGSKYDFSFSGLKTAVINKIHNCQQKGEEIIKEDVAAVFCHTVAEILTSRLFMAAEEYHYKKIVVAGGVSANSVLRAMLKERAAAENCQLYLPSMELCGDNAAMIGAQGYYEYLAGARAGMELNAIAYLPVDENTEFYSKI